MHYNFRKCTKLCIIQRLLHPQTTRAAFEERIQGRHMAMMLVAWSNY